MDENGQLEKWEELGVIFQEENQLNLYDDDDDDIV